MFKICRLATFTLSLFLLRPSQQPHTLDVCAKRADEPRQAVQRAEATRQRRRSSPSSTKPVEQELSLSRPEQWLCARATLCVEANDLALDEIGWLMVPNWLPLKGDALDAQQHQSSSTSAVISNSEQSSAAHRL